MKKKLVIWGINAQEEKVLIGIQLIAEENNTKIFTIPAKLSNGNVFNDMMEKWRMDQPFDFPEGTVETSRALSVSEGLLPEDIKIEKGDILVRAQAEWHFMVLSSKLHDAYKSELEDLKEKVDKLTEYDGAIWENLKGFWNKVQTQVQEKNLFRDHANTLRNDTNELFGKLKDLRAVLDEEFRSKSKTFRDDFLGMITAVETKLKENSNLNRLFEDLKGIQNKYRDTKFTREDRNAVWTKLDKTFKAVKEKKYGPDNAPGNSPDERLNRRLQGLNGAIDKMQRSINRDENDIKFENRRMDQTDGQLEMQIRQAKLKMLEERAKSKREKLEDMLNTKADLEKKVAKFAKKKAPKSSAENGGNEEKKVSDMSESSKPEENVADALGATVGEAIEDVVDTIKAVAGVVTEKISDAVTDFTEELKEQRKAREEEE